MVFKIELDKAYDSVRWKFMEDILKDIRLTKNFIRLVME